jgi:hypothetical protein
MAYEGGTECSEKSAHKIQTPGNHPKKNTTFTTWRKFELDKLLFNNIFGMWEKAAMPNLRLAQY